MIKNYTPHDIIYIRDDGTEEVFKSVGNIRVPTKSTKAEDIDCYECVRISQVQEKCNLPEQKDNVYYIVSSMVRLAFPERMDLISPGTAPEHVVRNGDGTVKGVRKFVRN